MDRFGLVGTIKYMVVNSDGDITNTQVLYNAVAPRTRDQLARALTTPWGEAPGTFGINRMYFRMDGSNILGSGFQWALADDGTTYSTRYNEATYITSVMFNATKTATANVTCKAVILTDSAFGGIVPAGTAMRFYSTSINMQTGSAGRFIVEWTITVV